jgi:hypothetical protein
VNVFSGILLPSVPDGWVCKDNIKWIPNCPLPLGELLARMPYEKVEGRMSGANESQGLD